MKKPTRKEFNEATTSAMRILLPYVGMMLFGVNIGLSVAPIVPAEHAETIRWGVIITSLCFIYASWLNRDDDDRRLMKKIDGFDMITYLPKQLLPHIAAIQFILHPDHRGFQIGIAVGRCVDTAMFAAELRQIADRLEADGDSDSD